jgi:FkbM family methyltransferase
MTIRKGVGAGLKINTQNASANYVDGTNELPVQRALAQYLKPGMVFYDIGANVGFFSLISARLVGPTGHVYAFEPVTENAMSLRLNARLNDLQNITVYEKGVSVSSGKGNLFLTKHPGGATLASRETLNSTVKGTVLIDLVCIDDLIAQKLISPPSLIKIDVEGAELDVLRGMDQTINEHSPVIIYETDDRCEETLRRKNKEIDDFLIAHRYKIAPLEPSYSGIKWNVRHAIATSSLQTDN